MSIFMSKTHKRSKSTEKNQDRPQLGGKKRLTYLSWSKILRQKDVKIGILDGGFGDGHMRELGKETHLYRIPTKEKLGIFLFLLCLGFFLKILFYLLI